MPSDVPAPLSLWAVWVYGEGWMRPKPGADIFVAWSAEAAGDAARLYCGETPAAYSVTRFDESLKDFEAVILAREQARQRERDERERAERESIIRQAKSRRWFGWRQ